MGKPLVSVVMITYGHYKYIKEAINGVLMQDCNFDIELIVANDCSPDDSDKIIKEIIANSSKSSWIKYTRHSVNIGMQPNFVWACEQARGKYLALCEGDDFWTDSRKLQKQVDFMENYNLDCCQTLWSDLINDNLVKQGHIPYGKNIGDNVIMDNKEVIYYHTSTRIIKNSVILELVSKYPKELLVDAALLILLTKHYKIGVLLEYMSVYRISNEGAWTSLSEKQKNKAHYKFFKSLQFYLPFDKRNYAEDKWMFWLKTYLNMNENLSTRIAKFIVRIEFYIR